MGTITHEVLKRVRDEIVNNVFCSEGLAKTCSENRNILFLRMSVRGP